MAGTERPVSLSMRVRVVPSPMSDRLTGRSQPVLLPETGSPGVETTVNVPSTVNTPVPGACCGPGSTGGRGPRRASVVVPRSAPAPNSP